jgi:hypothetical protein
MSDYIFLNWNDRLSCPLWEGGAWSYFGYGGAPKPGTRFLIKLSGVGIVGYGKITGKPFKVKNSDWPDQIPISVTFYSTSHPLSVRVLKLLGYEHLPWRRCTAMARLPNPEDGERIAAIFAARAKR